MEIWNPESGKIVTVLPRKITKPENETVQN